MQLRRGPQIGRLTEHGATILPVGLTANHQHTALYMGSVPPLTCNELHLIPPYEIAGEAQYWQDTLSRVI